MELTLVNESVGCHPSLKEQGEEEDGEENTKVDKVEEEEEEVEEEVELTLECVGRLP